jgi:OmpA-OmpF porin, OOP family
MPLTEKRVIVATVLTLLLLSLVCVWLHTQSTVVKHASTAAQAASATLKISAAGGVAVISGAVPDQAIKTVLINSAEKVFGLANVVDKIEVKAKLAEPIWIDQAKAAFPVLKSNVSNGTFVFKDKTVEVRGEVSGEDAKTKVLRAVGGVAGVDLTVNDQLQITAARRAGNKKAGPLQIKLNELLVGKSIEFDTSSSRLRSDSNRLLDAVADVLKADADAKIEISGHTDSKGTESKNVSLSKRRAEAVKKYLVDKGIKSNRIEAAGYGSSMPIADDSTFDGQRQNRRIEFQVQE